MRIYLFRGLGGLVFSTGLDALSNKLQTAGHETSVHSWLERTAVQNQAIADYKAGNHRNGIALIGHSLGGNSANYMGRNLMAGNVPVNYIATIDPTEPKSNPAGVVADNFRSSDFRAKKVDGATDFSLPHLNHIEIDKDDSVHARIVQQCGQPAQITVDKTVTADAISSPANSALELASAAAPDDAALIAILAALQSGDEAQMRAAYEKYGGSSAIHTSTDAVVSAETASKDSVSVEPEMPVKNALGKTIGDTLDGKKTALGIVGLLGTTVLPILFPQLAPVKAVLDTLNLGGPAVSDPGTSIFGPVFAALGSWGVLGKIEKWVKKTAGK